MAAKRKDNTAMASRTAIDDLHVEATEAETATVLEAARNGDSIPAGFTFNPHGKHVVMKLKDAEAEPAAPTGEGA